MKTLFTITLITLSVTFLRAQSALNREINFSQPSLSVREVIQAIQEQTSLRFSYGNTISLSQKIDFNSTQLTVGNILNLIKQKTGIQYRIKENKIILIPPATKHTISGYIRDAYSGENLIGSNIHLLPALSGTTANAYGFFSLTLAEDSVQLTASYTGYELYSSHFYLGKDTVINISLSSQILSEVVISSDAGDHIQEQSQMSSFDIPVQQLKAMPAIAGEVDIMKSLQLLPGVQAGNEGTSGLYVRGGGPDQNLILLDGVPIYNASHLFGFFSVFNADAINHVELIKGGFPARYGGRLSSVIDISMKEGNNQEIKGEGSFGLIASRLTVEGPIKKGKSSFIVSGRRTYIDLLARPFMKKQSGNLFGYYFYDFNTKFNYTPDRRNRFYFSTYIGGDKGFSKTEKSYQDDLSEARGNSKGESTMQWGNVISALRWNHLISQKLFSNLTMTYSRYAFKVFARNEDHMYYPNETEAHYLMKRLYESGIRDYTLKSDFDFTPSPNHYIRFGGYGIRHFFRPGATNLQSNDIDVVHPSTRVASTEYGAYAEDDITFSTRLKGNLGVHFSGLHVDGGDFSSFQPRLSLRYLIRKDLSAKVSLTTMTQYIHLLSNGGIGLPTDLWVPATTKIRPEESAQIATGLAYTPSPAYEITLEGYYKLMDGVIEYKEGASYVNTENDWENKIEIGTGKSYGLELFIQKKQGKFTGWLGYTFSKATRQFDNLNFGKSFPYRYDRRHDIELNVKRKLRKNIDLSATWVYGTGTPITVPVAEYATIPDYDIFPSLQFELADYYESRNNFRMRDYHRLDVSLSFRRERKWGERTWVIGVYNAYSRQNPFYVQLEYDANLNKKIYEHGLFPIIPSISYNFKF